MSGPYGLFTEEVRGIVIGPMTAPYEFWTRATPPTRICKAGSFESDDDAVAWFKERYPDHFKAGVEMRVFDQPEKP